MEKVNFPKRFRVYFPLIVLFLLLVLIMPKSPKFKYDYKKGSPWMHETLVAQFDFPVLKSEQQYLMELDKAGSTVIPYYKTDEHIAEEAISALSDIDLGIYSDKRGELADVLSEIFAKGVISETVGADESLDRVDTKAMIYVQKDRRAEKVAASEIYTEEQAEDVFRNEATRIFGTADVDSLMKITGLSALLTPNLRYDRQTTDLVHEERVDFVSRTQGIGKAGQVVVAEGEIVTAEIEQLLRSYEMEFEKNIGYNAPDALQWLGNIFIALFLVVVLFLAILYCNANIFQQFNKYLYLLIIFSLSAVASSLVARTDPSLFYMIPFTLIALYLLAFFKKRVVFTVYMISLLPLLIFAANGMELFVIYLVAGVVGILVFGYFNRGWLQFLTAFIVFVVMVCVWASFRLIDGPSGFTGYRVVLNMALAALMSVAGYPLIYLFEKIFALVSNSKLVELSDTGNPLLRQLADKAPGTFHHSLQVMNLADAAARSIDANILLVRAGALYHDIGKIGNPQCFTENEAAGVRYHEGLSPKESAREIIRHVDEGMAIADKHNLPDVVKEFILTHHGLSSAGYFLTTYLNEGGDPEDISDFYYHGMKPASKEQVILMICDGVEAASRSLKAYDEASISQLVEGIVASKIAEGQLSDADISLREINTVKAEIKSYLQQMYHSRVAYPKRQTKPAL